MTNRLVKDITVTEITPPIIGAPQIDGSTRQYLCGFYPRDAYLAAAARVGYSGFIVNSLDGELDYGLLTSTPPGVSADGMARMIDAYYDSAGWLPWFQWVYLCANFDVPYTIPAVDPQPGVYETNYHYGWTGAARSYDEFFNDGQVTFRVLPGGIYTVGLCSNPLAPTLPGNIEFGFQVFGNGVSIIESGTPTDPNYEGTVTDATVFKIKHSGGATRYYVDDVLIHTSAIIEGDEPGPRNFWLKACIWKGGDYVDSPTIGQLASGAMTLPMLQVIGGEGTQGMGAELTLPALTLDSHPAMGAAMTLPMLKLAGGRAYAFGEIVLSPLTMLSYVGGNTGFGAALRLPKPLLSGHVLSGTTGGATLTLPHLLLRGGRPTIESDITLPALMLLGHVDFTPGEAQMQSFVQALSALAPVTEVFVTMDSVGVVTSVFAVGIAVGASMDSSANATTSMVTTAILQAVMNSVLIGSSFIPIGEQANETWVVNLDGKATSTYENFGFNSFGKVGDEYIGVRGDGVYLLGGDDDAGAAIRGSIGYGKQKFDSNALKRMVSAYAGVASSGTMYLKVIVDDGTGGKEYIYAARRSDDFHRMQRIDVGLGIEATYLTFELFNSDGCDFELATVEFVAVGLTRRI